MQSDTRNGTDQQSLRRETENAAGAASNVNEQAATPRSEQAGQFLTWWKEYQKKMKSGFTSSPMKLQIQA
jgi:hypothetical protein